MDCEPTGVSRPFPTSHLPNPRYPKIARRTRVAASLFKPSVRFAATSLCERTISVLEGKPMTLTKEVFRALIYFALIHVYGCGSVGWLPSLSLAVAGIDRTVHQPGQTDRERLILKAEARLKWKLMKAPNQSISRPTDDGRTVSSGISYQKRRTGALYEWENRERNRVIDETNLGWRQ